MSDLEDVLSQLWKFKESLKEALKFVEKLEKLFGTVSSSYEMGGESISLEDLTNLIDDILIRNKKRKQEKYIHPFEGVKSNRLYKR